MRAMQPASRYLSARQVATTLGVSVATVYAYASRGLLQAEPVPGDPRASRYRNEDVERLSERRATRHDPERAVPRGLHWGLPVLDSALTLIDRGGLFYRGRDALALARAEPAERVAALLWTGHVEAAEALFSGRSPVPPRGLPRSTAHSPLGFVERCQAALPLAEARDPRAHDLRPEGVAATGARVLRLLAASMSGRRVAASVAQALQEAWRPERAALRAALDAALVLCADHELNVSAFTARCVASAGASPYDVVAAGLAALKGGRHGGLTARVEALFDETQRPRRAQEVVAARLRRGEALPGFGHRLYPEGDPRAALLLELAEQAAPRARAVETARALAGAAAACSGERPTLDLGLVTLRRALELPEGSALALFALGRSIGWIAHAIEQYAEGELIRPRARYVGPPPEGAGIAAARSRRRRRGAVESPP